MAIETSAAISPYSIAVAPFSSRHKPRNRAIAAVFPSGTHARGDLIPFPAGHKVAPMPIPQGAAQANPAVVPARGWYSQPTQPS